MFVLMCLCTLALHVINVFCITNMMCTCSVYFLCVWCVFVSYEPYTSLSQKHLPFPVAASGRITASILPRPSTLTVASSEQCVSPAPVSTASGSKMLVFTPEIPSPAASRLAPVSRTQDSTKVFSSPHTGAAHRAGAAHSAGAVLWVVGY